MRRGVRIGIDVGSVRVGVARSDPEGVLAVPVATLARGDTDIAGIQELVVEYEALEVLVGLPIGMDGREGKAAMTARAYADVLATAINPTPVRLVDERLTTVTAARALRDSGRTARESRSVVDQAAAVVIVEHALDSERSSGAAPGERLVVGE